MKTYTAGIMILVLASLLPARADFSVMAYNVENLFDVDGIARYDDYAETGDGSSYGPQKLLGKLRGITAVFQHVNNGRGPDVACLNELEVDNTPESTVTNQAEFLRQYRGTTVDKMLTTGLTAEVRGLPVEALLLKALTDGGLTGYCYVVANEQPTAEATNTIKNAVFTRLPILATHTWPTPLARGILEVTLDAEGRPLTVFVNHWKAGASDPALENLRLANAATQRKRLDELLAANPMAEVILAGDFNESYNQREIYARYMPKVALQDVLGSQGNEARMTQSNGPALYNLWFELPPDKRFTDEYDGSWGTLIQMLVSRGLYNGRDVDYVDQSFGPVILPGINARPPLNLPMHWNNATGKGVSDHFPIMARFHTLKTPQPGYAFTAPPAKGNDASTEPLPVGYGRLATSNIPDFATIQNKTEEEIRSHAGELFRVSGLVTLRKPVLVKAGSREYAWFSHDKAIMVEIKKHQKGDRVQFIAELNLFKGKQPYARERLEFVVQDPSWLK